jgi:xylitol oxidase
MTDPAHTPQTRPALVNWAGNHAYRTTGLREPASLDELGEIVRSARHLRVLGTRHAFNELTDTPGELVSLRGLPRRLEIDPGRRTVTIDGGLTYGELCGPLDAAGFALPNLASLPHISVAGAVSTATHGSGNLLGSLATSVVGLTLMRANEEIVAVGSPRDAGNADAGDALADMPLEGAVVALGSLGVIIELELALEPKYEMRQDVAEGLSFDAFADRFEEISASADSVSCFTDWSSPVFHQVWQKRRLRPGGDRDRPDPIPGTTPAREPRHPIPGYSAEACTAQLGVAGPWHERLPHFRLDHRPSAGAELQSEYFIDRSSAPAALAAVARLADRLAPLTLVSEIRTVAADRQWLSPASGRDTATFHFTWVPDWPAVRSVLPDVERALEPFEPRPHWAKLFTLPGAVVRDRYPDRPRFTELATRLDPEGVFRNPFVDACVFGDVPQS